MTNLLITIISIALVGIAAIMAAYYGGQAFMQSHAQIYANMLLSQSSQLMVTDMQYMLDHNLSSFDDFGADDPVIAKYTVGRVPILSLDTQGALGVPLSTSTKNNTTCDGAPGALTPVYLDGYEVLISRANGKFFGTNAIIYNLWITTGPACSVPGTAQDFSMASMANHPLVQMCKAVNAMTTLPSGLTYSASGLPENVGGITYDGTINIDYDNNAAEVNYCYIGPNSFWGSGYPEMFFVFTN